MKTKHIVKSNLWSAMDMLPVSYCLNAGIRFDRSEQPNTGGLRS